MPLSMTRYTVNLTKRIESYPEWKGEGDYEEAVESHKEN